MEYAIETLQIELFKCKDTLRTIQANEHSIMSNIPMGDTYSIRIHELEAAIAKLNEPSFKDVCEWLQVMCVKNIDTCDCELTNGKECCFDGFPHIMIDKVVDLYKKLKGE